MKVESAIKDILKEQETPEEKADKITKFMNWNRDKLIKAIEKYKTAIPEGQEEVINEFWRKNGIRRNKR